MPIYEFECRGCENRFEKLCGVNASLDDLTCPSCGGGDIRKMVSSFASMSKDSHGTSSSSTSCGSCTRSSCAGCH